MLTNDADLSVAQPSRLSSCSLDGCLVGQLEILQKKSIFSINHKNVAHGNHIITYMYSSVQGKRPLLGKHPCTAFQGATVAASIQTFGILITNMGQNCKLCLSTHGRLSRTQWYMHRACQVLYGAPCPALADSLSLSLPLPRALFDGQRKKLDAQFKPPRQAFIMCNYCSKSISSDSQRHGGHIIIIIISYFANDHVIIM